MYFLWKLQRPARIQLSAGCDFSYKICRNQLCRKIEGAFLIKRTTVLVICRRSVLQNVSRCKCKQNGYTSNNLKHKTNTTNCYIRRTKPGTVKKQNFRTANNSRCRLRFFSTAQNKIPSNYCAPYTQLTTCRLIISNVQCPFTPLTPCTLTTSNVQCPLHTNNHLYTHYIQRTVPPSHH
jgi:hypothetical protein